MLKYLTFILLFCGCYSAKNARQQMDKAKIKFPSVAAEKCAFWYPVEVVSITTDTSSYALWKSKLDSIDQHISGVIADTIKDTIIRNIVTKDIINSYKTFYRRLPPIHDTIRIIDKAHQEAEVIKKSDAEENLYKEYKKTNTFLFFALILILILFTILFIKK